MDMHALLITGLLLCPGSVDLKVRLFYDLLQDTLQETIAASDRDFEKIFPKILEFAVITIPDFENQVTKKKAEGWTNVYVDNIEDINDFIKDKFLDSVFDYKAKMERAEFMDLVKKNH